MSLRAASDYLSRTEDIAATQVSSVVGIPLGDFQFMASTAIGDAYVFGKLVCGHRELTPTNHRVLAYIYAGDFLKLSHAIRYKLIDCYAMAQLRDQLAKKGIDVSTNTGILRFREILRSLNIRVSRAGAKSSVGTHSDSLLKITADPNQTIAIITGTNDGAAMFNDQIKKTIWSPLYGKLFPHRLPPDETFTTVSEILLSGRTTPAMEPCIKAMGYESNWTKMHFGIFKLDDIVSEENSSPVELMKTKKFLSNLPGLHHPIIPVQEHYTGTRYDEQDEYAELAANENFLTIVIPIEEHEGEVEDLEIQGKLTMSDWFPREKVEALRKRVLQDKINGPNSWRCNYLLRPSAGGGRLFTEQLIERSCYRWVKDQASGRLYIQRPMLGPDKQPLMDEKGMPKHVLIDPKSLFIVLGCDQAFSEEDTADEYAITVLGADREGYEYQIDTVAGRGQAGMMEALMLADRLYRPRVIGLEKAAQQVATLNWMKSDPIFSGMRGRLRGIEHNNVKKVIRLRDSVSERMKMRKLWLNPQATELHREMILFRGTQKNAKDNRLDSLAIATVSNERGTTRSGRDDIKVKRLERDRLYHQSVDPGTGVPFFAYE